MQDLGAAQRVAVVRALINEPGLLLADEPTGALDRHAAENLGQLLVELNQETEVTLVVVTHSMELARTMGRVMEWFFSLSFVGLGLLTKLSDLRKAGAKGLVIGYTAGSLRLLLCLILIYIATKMGMLN